MSRRRRGGCLRRLFALTLVLVVLAVGAMLLLVQQTHRLPNPEVIVEIPRGTGTVAMAGLLERQGVIGGRTLFLAAWMLRGQPRLQAGEYRFNNAIAPWDVVRKIAKGEVFYYEVTVPEGANLFDIATALKPDGVIAYQDFLTAVRDPSPIHDLDPKAPTLEGYLFPATYRYTRTTTAKALAHDMVVRFRRAWRDLHPAQGTDIHRIVTLASLVEKETAQPSERPLIAAVFRNRLHAGMTLDCDPTTIYAALLEDRYRGTIYRSDLDSRNPYNTYRNAGLPPGPIANPGGQALQAALSPADVNYLYFVAKPGSSGAHQFSATLAEHERAVAQYRRGQRSN